MKRVLKFFIAASIAALGIMYFKAGAGFVMNLMPTPWQCDLPGPPASCDGNIIVGAMLGLLFYTAIAVVVPAVYAIKQLVDACKTRSRSVNV